VTAGGELQIRRMTMADLDRVMEIAAGLRDAPHWTRAAYQAAIDPNRAPQRIALVAEDAGNLAGFAIASVVVPQAELETIAVAEAYQRRGVALRLFAALAGELSEAQAADVLLEVRASNRPALGLYRALGFEEGGRRPRYYADPVEDAVLLKMCLRG
jgi:ribosomal-protein-alanine N-acetyltransferase